MKARKETIGRVRPEQARKCPKFLTTGYQLLHGNEELLPTLFLVIQGIR
jgi:hypothetical protein